MDSKDLQKQLKNGIVIHRLVYVVFICLRMFLQVQKKDMMMRNTAYILAFVVSCVIIEEVIYCLDFSKRIRLVRFLRYMQCLISTLMLCFLQNNDISDIAVIALMILFLVDLFLTMQITDVHMLFSYMLTVAIPLATVVIIKISLNPSDEWIFMFFDLTLLFMVLFYEAYTLVNYVNNLENAYLSQCNMVDDIVKKNEEIVAVQDKLQEVNYTLNTQKNDLEHANRKIKEANAEMTAQAEILHYIAMSFDFPKISNQILDSIMKIKKIGFCAVYIKKDVYRNRHANYVIKTEIGQLQSKIRDNMDDIFLDMDEKQISEKIYYSDLKATFPFLKGVNINTMYVRLLQMDNESYGLFMLGDNRSTTFDQNMSFYDAIIAQYDIAVTNAKIYSDMEYMAQKDGLTGINNRIHFSKLFRHAVELVRQQHDNISVALLDIDKFKSVNDTYGHLAGDEVIKRVASITEECIEKYDGFVCRYGGEEFVAVLPNRKLEVATPIVEELFEQLCSQIIHYNEVDIPLSVSIGLTSYPEVCDNPDELLKRADWCMYYSKEHGRHQIKVDDGTIQRD